MQPIAPPFIIRAPRPGLKGPEMQSLRASLILLGFFAFTFPLMPVQLLLLAIKSRHARTFPHWYHRNVCRLLGIRIHVEGKLANDRPVFVVANHVSWLDIPVLSAVGPVSFVAKREVSGWPFVSWLAKLQRSVFVDRTRRIMARHSASEIARRLAGGDTMVLFAEGTSSDGNRVMPFKTALFAVAGLGPIAENDMSEEICTQTLALAYTHRYGLPLGRRGRSNVAWFGEKELASHAWAILKEGPLDVRVKIGGPIALSQFQDRKSLALFSERRVREDVVALITARDGRGSRQGETAGLTGGVDLFAESVILSKTGQKIQTLSPNGVAKGRFESGRR